MIHPHTEVRFISPEKGYGVVATHFIPKGTITWVLDPLDRIITVEEVSNWPPLILEKLETFSFRNSQGNHVLCWDFGKYINHSFNSNCITSAYDFEIAVRDIQVGEELTDDYGYLNLSEAFEAVRERGTKRTHVYPDDMLTYHRSWDAKLRNAFKSLLTVEQPLTKYMPEEMWEKAEKVASGQEKMQSIKACYYDQSLVQIFDQAKAE